MNDSSNYKTNTRSVTDNSDIFRNIIHNNEWKEEVFQLPERTNHILSILGEIWNNPAFMSSEIRSDQARGLILHM
ncbi:hypothetical protein GLOIN_2v1776328 [Rhizophagus clarus]|uniref:Uncharacterized protein n=1 Tax=Rhizophagus clarus TaxID=94130 RepID=A0A8H3L893_9GLOM|nr:hypothetical protein GLOIN_2v1776328 [Rhizophagus clarus]